ncbi:MAG: hypothetical protein HYS98_07755 [Deltaproteobacteria bacterium]|nr:hypothetical protein [Deltaproteobacteria bacterium]
MIQGLIVFFIPQGPYDHNGVRHLVFGLLDARADEKAYHRAARLLDSLIGRGNRLIGDDAKSLAFINHLSSIYMETNDSYIVEDVANLLSAYPEEREIIAAQLMNSFLSVSDIAVFQKRERRLEKLGNEHKEKVITFLNKLYKDSENLSLPQKKIFNLEFIYLGCELENANLDFVTENYLKLNVDSERIDFIDSFVMLTNPNMKRLLKNFKEKLTSGGDLEKLNIAFALNQLGGMLMTQESILSREGDDTNQEHRLSPWDENPNVLIEDLRKIFDETSGENLKKESALALGVLLRSIDDALRAYLENIRNEDTNSFYGQRAQMILDSLQK